MDPKWVQAIPRRRDGIVGQFSEASVKARGQTAVGDSVCLACWYQPSELLRAWLFRLRVSYGECRSCSP